MKIPIFFKILNRKINKYDKMAQNPINVTLIWINDVPEKKEYGRNFFMKFRDENVIGE